MYSESSYEQASHFSGFFNCNCRANLVKFDLKWKALQSDFELFSLKLWQLLNENARRIYSLFPSHVLFKYFFPRYSCWAIKSQFVATSTYHLHALHLLILYKSLLTVQLRWNQKRTLRWFLMVNKQFTMMQLTRCRLLRIIDMPWVLSSVVTLESQFSVIFM